MPIEILEKTKIKKADTEAIKRDIEARGGPLYLSSDQAQKYNIEIPTGASIECRWEYHMLLFRPPNTVQRLLLNTLRLTGYKFMIPQEQNLEDYSELCKNSTSLECECE